VKRVAITHAKNDDCSLGIVIKRTIERSKPVLSSSVPDLDADFLFLESNCLWHKFQSNCGVHADIKFIICISRYDIRFAHSTLTFVTISIPTTTIFISGKSASSSVISRFMDHSINYYYLLCTSYIYSFISLCYSWEIYIIDTLSWSNYSMPTRNSKIGFSVLALLKLVTRS
jgi:hypothetical protein